MRPRNRKPTHPGKLHDGALFPMFGALCFLVVRDEETGEFVWRVGSLEEVKKLFESVSAETVLATAASAPPFGRGREAAVPARGSRPRAGGGDAERSRPLTYNTSLTYGPRATSLPRDDNLWNTLYKTVALAYFERCAKTENRVSVGSD